MELVGDDRSRSEARSPHERREALIGRDDEVRLFRADGLPMITGRDAEADVGGFEEIVEMVVDLAVNDVGLYQHVEKTWENQDLKPAIQQGLEKRALLEMLEKRID